MAAVQAFPSFNATSSHGVHPGDRAFGGRPTEHAWPRSRRTGSTPPAGWPPGRAGPPGAAGQPAATAALPAAPPRRPQIWHWRRHGTVPPLPACTAGLQTLPVWLVVPLSCRECCSGIQIRSDHITSLAVAQALRAASECFRHAWPAALPHIEEAVGVIPYLSQSISSLTTGTAAIGTSLRTSCAQQRLCTGLVWTLRHQSTFCSSMSQPME